MTDYLKQENGNQGQLRSHQILSKDFWALLRPVDADGVDLLVQEKYKNSAEIRAARVKPPSMAGIQAKYFTGDNQVNIPKSYVLDENEDPRRGFLAFLHTDDASGNEVHYLFSAEDIKFEWKETKDKKEYYFSLKDGREYRAYRGLSRDDIKLKVATAIRQGFDQSIMWGWALAADMYSFVRPIECLEPRYQLLTVAGARVVVFDGWASQGPYMLEIRRDVYPHHGTFDWGYGGDGPKLLAASLLTHFLCGRRPEQSEINRVVMFLLEEVKEDNLSFGRDQIFNALARMSHVVDMTKDSAETLRHQYDDMLDVYAKYFSDPIALAMPWHGNRIPGNLWPSEVEADELPQS
jgi:hypothetical protein